MKIKELEDRMATAVSAWSTLRPTKSFCGMTLAEFTAAIKPSLDARGTMDDLESGLIATRVKRDVADSVSWPILQRIVAAIVADKDEGSDGELYKAMGYVRRSERASGLIRGNHSDAVQPEAAKAA